MSGPAAVVAAEQAAQAVLDRARTEFAALDLAWDPYYLDVEMVGAVLFGLGVERVNGLRAGQREYAGILDAGSRLIAVENGDHSHRQRFSIAHELGHWVLHVDHGAGLYACTPEDMAEAGADLRSLHVRRETEANRFAGALLMPEAPLRAMHRATGGKVARLAAHFHVSLQAMEIRLTRLRLPGK